MKDNIKPEHYRKGEIDLYEAFSQIFPHNEYRAGMQMIAMRYMFRDKIDRVEDLGKSIYTLERLKEKEIEHREKQEKVKSNKTLKEAIADIDKGFDEWLRNKEDSESIDLLKCLYERGFNYLARDKNEELWAYDAQPIKLTQSWMRLTGGWGEKVGTDNFPEVKWAYDEPTEIAELLEAYENGGENGKVEQTPLYYAKIKGCEILGKHSHWIYLKNLKEFTIGTSSASHMEIDVMTKEEWNKLGINETNADFEEVEVWEIDLSESYKKDGENGK